MSVDELRKYFEMADDLRNSGRDLLRLAKGSDKHKTDITASVMCVKGDGIQRCPGFIQRGGIGIDNKRIITALLP